MRKGQTHCKTAGSACVSATAVARARVQDAGIAQTVEHQRWKLDERKCDGTKVNQEHWHIQKEYFKRAVVLADKVILSALKRMQDCQ